MKRIEGKRRGREGAWKNRGGKKRWRGGEARFSFLSASTADKGHCGGSYCGGLTYARVYAYVEPIWMRARAPYRSHPYVSSHEESGLTHAPTVTTYLYICIYIYARQSFPNLVYSILENTRNFFAIQFWSFEFVSYPNGYYLYISRVLQI